ncbi:MULTISPECIES: ZrgA family zinc uptake protein [Thalassolituus]|uniref:ZrgA family zinc uptake protein n=3 Tax=Oceanospirillaceae TaxID=135620 RepID=UPI000C5F9BDD|nr:MULTISPECIES: DUF2796 domain-containing protein [Thalassolituus]MAX85351.1 hypothetical protein [Oceanospirillaceae bacterium]|tara:strand:+ start:4702 stop:5379 length:678 start_codon:yes stop_codon:yes gene_type:complete
MTLKRPVKHAIHNYALFPAVRVSSSVALMVASMLTVMSAGVAAAESHDHHEEHEHHESHDHDEHPDHQESDHQGHDHHGGEHHGAHIHGVGHLNVAVEGSMVTVYLQTPAADIIGFEHVAENKEERTKVAAAHKKLNDASSLFQFTGADCTVVAGSGVEVPQSDSEASDVIAEYTFECEDGQLPESMAVELSTEFPDLKVLKAVWLTEDSTGTKELTAKDHTIHF